MRGAGLIAVLALVLGAKYFGGLANAALGVQYSFVRFTSFGLDQGKIVVRFFFRLSNASGTAIKIEGLFGDVFSMLTKGKSTTPYKVGDFTFNVSSPITYTVPTQGVVEIPIKATFVVSDVLMYLLAKGSQLTEIQVVSKVLAGDFSEIFDDLLFKGSVKSDRITYPFEYLHKM